MTVACGGIITMPLGIVCPRALIGSHSRWTLSLGKYSFIFNSLNTPTRRTTSRVVITASMEAWICFWLNMLWVPSITRLYWSTLLSPFRSIYPLYASDTWRSIVLWGVFFFRPEAFTTVNTSNIVVWVVTLKMEALRFSETLVAKVPTAGLVKLWYA
jgi:hypothetical protein